jgi:glycine/D-amino acid oxidase-like deaminating enzyme
LSSALRLAEAGQSVIVIDRTGIGSQASGFALGRVDPLLGGILAPDSDEEQSTPIPMKPAGQWDLGVTGHALILKFAEEFQETSGIDFELDHQATLQLCYAVAERPALAEKIDEWRAHGFDGEALDPRQITNIDDRIVAPEHGGVLVKGPFFLDALKYAYTLAKCAEIAGVEIVSGEVTGISVDGESSATVETQTRSFATGAVLVTAGPWTGMISGMVGPEIPLTPSKGEILRLEPPDGPALPIHLHGPCSLVYKRDGFVWAAATAAEEGFDRTPTKWAEETLIQHATEMMPSVMEGRLSQHTVCFRPASPDGMPIIGRLGADVPVWVATGGGGSGVMQSLAVGDLNTEMITKRVDEAGVEGVSPRRFQNP